MLTLVIPIYKSEANIPTLLPALEQLQTRLRLQLEVVFVVDGSPDRSWAILREALPKHSFASQLLVLSRNFGAFSAVRAGLSAGKGDHFVVVAADMQEPPSLIEKFSQSLRGEYDVAVGTRTSRHDPLLSALSSRIFWALYRRFVVSDIPEGGVDVFGCTRRVRDELIAFNEHNTSLISLLFWLGFRRIDVPYERLKREQGKSSWTLAKKMRYMSDSIYAFSDLPLRVLTYSGAIGIALSLVLGAAVTWGKLAGRISVPGYTITVILIMFFGGLNSAGLGLIGGYLWRTYENTKQRPLFRVMQHESFGGSRHLEVSHDHA